MYVATENDLKVWDKSGSKFKPGYAITVPVFSVFSDHTGKNVYAVTHSGLKVSNDYGVNFAVAIGLPSDNVRAVYANGQNVYALTATAENLSEGLSISTDGGQNFAAPKAIYTSPMIATGVYILHPSYRTIAQSIILVSSNLGLSISLDNGDTFSAPVSSGLGTTDFRDIYAKGATLYVATQDLTGTDNGIGLATLREFVNRTTGDGLGSNVVHAVSAKGGTGYAATDIGLSKSVDVGNKLFTPVTLPTGSKQVYDVAVTGNKVYAATHEGLAENLDDGKSYQLKTTADNLDSDVVQTVFTNGTTVFVGTNLGLSRSTDSGNNFTSVADLYGEDIADGFASGSDVYVATPTGLYRSTNDGKNFAATPVLSGNIHAVYVDCNNIYAATETQGLQKSTLSSGILSPWTSISVFSSEKMRAVFASGNIIYGGTTTAGTGVNAPYDYSHYVFSKTESSLGDDVINGIAVDGDTLFVATKKGLAIGPS